MSKRDSIYRLCIFSAFVAVFVAFAPLPVFAVTVMNTVESYANTGGQNGTDGTDGADGSDGADGKDGQAGASYSGEGKASVHIETTVNGKKVIDVYESKESHAGEPLHIQAEGSYGGDANTADVGAVSADAGAETQPASGELVEINEEQKTGLLALLESIRLILLSYVTKLF